MKEPDNLHKLVKSLTKTEKAYFKKYASRHVLGMQNKYVVLFTEISRNINCYDEIEIKKKYHNEKFVRNFPVMKKYLSEMILKSLSSYYSDSNPGHKVRNELRYIEILYKKGLFGSCVKIINRAIKLAYKADDFLLILELLKWKKNLINEGVYKGVNKENEYTNIEKACLDELEIINKLKNLSDYRRLSYRVRSYITGTNKLQSGEDLRRALLKILKDKLLQSEHRALSHPAMLLYYHTLADVNDSVGNYRKAFECRKRLVSVMESRPDTIRANISNYIRFIFNLLGTCLNLKIYNELEYYIKKLRFLEKTFPCKYSETDRLYIFMGSLVFALRMHISKGEFSKSIGIISEIEKGLKVFSGKVVKSDELYFFYLISYAYFGAGRINESLIWINKVLNDKEVYQDRKLCVKSKVINLILHYELGNFELLDYLVKSTYRFLIKNKFDGYDEKIAIEFLRQLTCISNQNQLLNLFSESLFKLKTNQKNSQLSSQGLDSVQSFEVQNNFTNIAEFDLVSWLESKISGKSFEEIVRSKHII